MKKKNKETELSAEQDVQDVQAEEQTQTSSKRKKKVKKKKKRHILLKLFALIDILILIGCIAVIVYVGNIIKETPPIETNNVYSLLSQTSTVYDSTGQVIDNIFGDQNRTIVTIDQIPEHVQDAFIALEDKTFRTHHGFNIIRIFGAIKDKLLHGGSISGTSTITQQLARNLYLEDTMSVHSMTRKIQEAYYAYILEKNLSKDQILEAYLNTINFGAGWGIQSAATAYFDKSVSDLTLQEAAALATLPQRPSAYALVLRLYPDQLGDYADKVIYTDSEFAYCWNDACSDRMKYCLALMLEQGYITQEEYDSAIDFSIPEMIHPHKDEGVANTSYFADFVVSSVIQDFQDQFGYDERTATNLVYNGGLQIYSTMDPQAQSILEKEFEVYSNFPQPYYYTTDSAGNILKPDGNVMLYKYENYINENTFLFRSDEWLRNENGDIELVYGKRLRFYITESNGVKSISVEMPKLYRWVDGYMYIIDGAYLNGLSQYATLTDTNNVLLSPDLFTNSPDTLQFDTNGNLYTTKFSLKTETIQPQSAMTVIDNSTGAVVAMIGGRGQTGKLLYNRAIKPRQPGSSIKPLSVYSAALQKSFELAAAGKKWEYIKTGYDAQGTNLWGDYITAASVVIDEKMTVNGKEWPKNASKKYSGAQTFRSALQQSINTCAIKILAQVGVDYAFQNVTNFGISTLVGEGEVNDVNLAALGLGAMTNGVTTLDMASAYSTFVNDGVHRSYYTYTQVTDRNGVVLMEPKRTETQVLDPGVAWIMRDILQSVVYQGIGGNAKINGEIVGGKTGTSGSQKENIDIWFDGFTANYTASIWIGADVNLGLSEQSPKAARLWSTIMSQIEKAHGGSYSARPSNVVTAKTGGGTEYFTKGTEKNAGGNAKFMEVTICKDTGLLATPDCPNVEKVKGYSIKTSDGKTDDTKYESGSIIILPTSYCYMHNTDPSKYPVASKYKSLLDKYTEERAKADQKAADAVIKAIDALPSPEAVTTKHASAIQSARKKYDALTSAQQQLVPSDKVKKLAACEKALQAAIDKEAQDAADRNAAEQFCAMVMNLTPGDADAIYAAQAAYNALSPGAKAYVPQEILDRLNQLIADLQSGGGGDDPGTGDGGNDIVSPRFFDPVLLLSLNLPVRLENRF
ncbi:MAG: transglycosylase domain-containing protein [Firmicutes bacterium]|nr:transglycosylase domain-containing protein [Bacillota bacterium]